MENYVIITDSSADLSAEICQSLDIQVLSLEVVFDDKTTKKNHEVDVKEFYAMLRAKKHITTSAVNIERFSDFFETYLAEGKDILYLGFSSGLSGTYNAAFVAAQDLAEKYPDRKVWAVDTLCASLGQGMFVYLCAKMRQNGSSIEEVRDWAEENKLHLCHWFTVDDLFFLKRGGRVSAATAVMGTMLSIKPVMHVDNKGKLINVQKARGRKGSIDELFKKVKEGAVAPETQTMFICHGDCVEDANYLADRMKRELNVPEVIVDFTGPVIGAHSGPGTLAVFYIGTER